MYALIGLKACVKLLTFAFVDVRVTFPPVLFPGMELRTLSRVFFLTTQSVIPLNWGRVKCRSDVKNVLFCQKMNEKIR